MKFGNDQLDAVFGRGRDGNVLFWAHHEKLCLVDRKLAFMGGLDLCFGRWDTNQHPLSDLHANIATTVFPGQDYNNARIMDFNDVAKPFENKLGTSFKAPENMCRLVCTDGDIFTVTIDMVSLILALKLLLCSKNATPNSTDTS